jgi:hypothetical protein
MTGEPTQSANPAVPVGQPVNPPQEGEGGSAQVSLTPDQIQQIAQSIIEKTEVGRRLQQSLADITRDRVEKAVQQEVNRLKALNIELTQQQVDALRARAAELQGQPSPPPGAPPVAHPVAQPDAYPMPSGGQGVEGELDPIVVDALRLMDEAGVQIEDTDPELSLIDQETDSPYKFLKSVEAAIAKKKERLQAKEVGAGLPTLGSGGGPAGVDHTLTPHDLFKQAYGKR